MVVLVIDNGSGFCKAGYAGGRTPEIVVQTVVGRPREAVSGELLFGGEAQTSNHLDLVYPISRGIITNWENMEKMWEYILHHKLKVNPTEHSILQTESPLNPKTNREKMAEIMFERFKVPAMCMMNEALLALYASGRDTGLVLDSGDGMTNAVPVHDGYSLPNYIRQVNLAGRHVTDNLIKRLTERGYSFITAGDREMVRDIKEKFCHVALDFKQEMASSSSLDKTCQLPDGQIITVGNEQFSSPEILFQPSLTGSETIGIHQAAHESIMRSDVAIRNSLYSNIVLSGGTMTCPGIAARLEKEIKLLAPHSARVQTVVSPETKYLVWIGGSITAGLSSFETACISRAEYDESGPIIVNRK